MHIQRLEGSIYQYGNLSVVPYPSDRALALAFIRFDDEDLLGDIFHEWKPPLRWLLEKFQQPENVVLGLTVEQDGVYKSAGIAWYNQLNGNPANKRAEAGAGLFREFHGSPFKVAVPLIHMATEWAFKELKLDTLWGITPVPNSGMAAILKRLGYKQCRIEQYTVFRGEPCDAWVSTMTRERWWPSDKQEEVEPWAAVDHLQPSNPK